MNGGMMKAAGPGAVATLAVLLMSTGSVFAADLGGNCCADLEERVAELEATTARKGNRKVSLTVYGWVHKSIMYWNDGEQSNTYFGVDNTNYATRFGLRGDAKINPNTKAGFNILIDLISSSTTAAVRRDREEGVTSAVPDGAVVPTHGVGSWNEDFTMRVRDANVWMEHTRLGRVTLGHLTNPGPQGIVDLGGVAVASVAAIDLVGGAFQFRSSATGATTSATIANNTTNVADFSHRTDSIRWDSPTLAGFVLSAAVGEAAHVDRDGPAAFTNSSGAGPVGTYWAVALRYAGEYHGFRVAAAAAYEDSEAEERMGSSSALGLISDASSNIGYSLSVMHIASGLFLQGSHITFERGNLDATGGGSDTGTLWQVQGGISQNWTGLGKTALYGEYARGNNLQRAFATDAADVALTNEYTMWGLGVVQNIDAAAMELYLTYRRHSLNRDADDDLAVQDVDIILGGARIAF